LKSNAFIPAFASSLLLSTAFFPLNWGPVAYIALVPFLSLVRAEGIGNARRYLAAWLGGWAFFLLALKWIRVAHPMMELFAWPGISLYCSLYFPAALFLLRRLDRLKLPFAFTLPVVWVALEYVRTHFPTGFPFLEYGKLQTQVGFGWYSLGYTQHAFLPLLQTADLGGVYLVSAVVACVNGIAYEWAMRMSPFRWFINVPRPWQPFIFYREMKITAYGVLFAVVITSYGTYRLIHKPFEVGPRVALLQGNISQDDKMQRGEQKDSDDAPVDREYIPLAMRAARPETGEKPDLIVWPETCWGDNWFDMLRNVPDDPKIPDTAKQVRRRQADLAARARHFAPTNVLLGLNTQEWDGNRWHKFNSALLLKPDETRFFGDRYDKIHLVPFGEYVPLRSTFPWMSVFSPYKWDYSCTPGTNYTKFEFNALEKKFRSGKEITKGTEASAPQERTYRFGVLICYEDSDPQLARRYNQWGKDGPVDFLVNISNDGWFLGTEEHEQHLAISRFRAVEARRSLLRAVNMGISAIIDADGRIVKLPDFEWDTSKRKVAAVTGEVPIDDRGSPYAFAGDWVPALAWAILIGLHVYSKRRAS
jgi:apolipoprotein N-acyltransferase